MFYYLAATEHTKLNLPQSAQGLKFLDGTLWKEGASGHGLSSIYA